MTTAVRAMRTSLDHGFARFLRMIVTGTIGAAILNLLAWWLAEGVNGTRLMVMPPNSEVLQGLSAGVLLTVGLVSAIGAALLYWILDRVTNSPRLWFVIISLIVLVAMYFPVANLPVDGAVKMWLNILHLTTAIGIIWAVAYVSGWFPIRDRSA